MGTWFDAEMRERLGTAPGSRVSRVRTLHGGLLVGWQRYRSLARALVPYLLLAFLILLFSVMSPYFFSLDNGFNILRASATLLVISAGATLVVVLGSVDLSVGAVATLTGTIVAMLSANNHGPAPLLVAIPIGIACGLINGTLVALGRLPSFLATLGTLFIYSGIAVKLTGGYAVPLQNPILDNLVNGTAVGGLPNLTFWALAAVGVVCLIAYRTTFGRHLYAIGGNERVARLAGLAVRLDKVLIFTFSGLLAAAAGLMLDARGGGSSATMGDPYLLNAIAAIVMGGTSLSGGTGGPARTILGVLTITVLANGMTLLEVDPRYQSIVFGVIVILAVAFTVRREELVAVK